MTQSKEARERPRKRLSRVERHDDLLDAAAVLVAAQGLKGVTMEGVAHAAGVSKALPYAYFDNADDLLVALFDREAAELDRRSNEAMAKASDFEGRLRAVLQTLFEVLRERGVLVGWLNVPHPPGPLERRRRERQLTVEDFFAEMVADEYGIPVAEARVAAATFQAGLTALIDLWVRRHMRRADLIEVYVAMAVGVARTLAGRHRRAGG